MRKSKPLTADTLAELGADRLASLLLDTAEDDAAVARTLQIAASAAIDPEIKRLKRGTSLVDYKRMPAFARDPARRCVFCRRRVTGSPSAQISPALE